MIIGVVIGLVLAALAVLAYRVVRKPAPTPPPVEPPPPPHEARPDLGAIEIEGD